MAGRTQYKPSHPRLKLAVLLQGLRTRRASEYGTSYFCQERIFALKLERDLKLCELEKRGIFQVPRV